MSTLFHVDEYDGWVVVKNTSVNPVYSTVFYLNNSLIKPYLYKGNYFITTEHLSPGEHRLQLIASMGFPGGIYPVNERHLFIKQPISAYSSRNRTFQSGDILVASDNLGGLPPGYMGHSSIVVDPEHIVEASSDFPIVRQTKIQQFLQYHPLHAHYRPKSPELGRNAARFALQYVNQYNSKVANGDNNLAFSLSHNQKLDDGWTAIYCSKLVWLSYFFGANYRFDNDFLWFSPEDLSNVLSKDPNFTQMYAHPKFGFKINT